MSNKIFILSEKEIKSLVHLDLNIIAEIEKAFVALAKGEVEMPPILSMEMKDQRGEVDVKTAYIKNFDGFAVKISPGFFNNPSLGLPSLNGLMILFSSKTGLVQSLLLDNGYLTDVRTAAAGAISIKYLSNQNTKSLGIIGSGLQARLQAQAACLVRKFETITVWGRDQLKAEKCAEDIKQITKIDCKVELDIEKVVKENEVLITTTPSKEFLIKESWIQKGQHITAMGSDNSEKNEIDPNIFKSIDLFVPDRNSQSKKLGELRTAIKNKIVKENDIFPELGNIIVDPKLGRSNENQITLCDLTGTGVQDTAIATLTDKLAKEKNIGKIIEN
ncbi:cyclodeaminase [Candidatus Pelagibacter sp.]|jgi:ornithine cyclodeaminase|nr:cyclodeaminase [Candidatus Pelagibacter sp.]